MSKCSVTICSHPSRSRGLCSGHYARLRRSGSLNKNAPINIMEWHGGSRTPEHIAWAAMRSRCLKKSNSAYPDYGSRGISICKRWASFRNFLQDMGNRPGPRYALERINNSIGYRPSNCRWATFTEQNRNRRNVKLSPAKARKVRRLAAAGENSLVIATMLGVNRGTINKIIRGEAWKE